MAHQHHDHDHGHDSEKQQPLDRGRDRDDNFQSPIDLPVLSTSVSHPSTARHDPSSAPTNDAEPTYPEGGREAWSVVFGSFVSMIAGFGVMNTVGTFQAHLAANQLAHKSEGEIGWIFGIYCFVAFFGGIWIGPIFDAYGPRWLLFAGSCCLVVGLTTFSFCTQYWQFVLCFSLLTGMGTCLIFTPSVAAVGHWFFKRRGYATGLSCTGGSIGGIIFPLTFQAAVPRVGFAWSIRILALICLVLLCAGNGLVRGRNAEINAPASSASTISSTGADISKPPAKKPAVKIDLTAFRDPRFALTTMGVFLIEWGVFTPITYITSYGIHLGLSSPFSYQLLAILNVGSVFGRWLPGLIADRLGRFNTMVITVTLCFMTVVCFWLPTALVPHLPTTSAKALMTVFALIYGFGSGSGISLTPVCVGQICTTKEYGSKFGTCYFFVSFGTLTGVPIAGQILQVTRGGGYEGLIAFTAASYVGALLCFGAARVVGGGWGMKTVY